MSKYSVQIYVTNNSRNINTAGLMVFLRENAAKMGNAGLIFDIIPVINGNNKNLKCLPALVCHGETTKYGVGAIRSFLWELQARMLKNTPSRSSKEILTQDDEDEKGNTVSEKVENITKEMSGFISRRTSQKRGEPAVARKNNVAADDEPASISAGQEQQDAEMMEKFRRNHVNSMPSF